MMGSWVIHPGTPFGLPVFSLFYLAGTGVALGVAYLLLRSDSQIQARQARRSLDVLGLVWVAGLLGAKGLFWVYHPEVLTGLWVRPSQWIYFLEGGYELSGGLVGGAGMLGLCLWVWRKQLCIESLMGLVCVAVPLGLGVGRMGCLLAGCCYGLPASSNTWLAVQYPGSPVSRIAVQAYQGISLIGLGVLNGVIYQALGRVGLRSQRAHGLLPIFLVTYGALRLTDLSFRDPHGLQGPWVWGWHVSQWLALSFAVGGLIVGAAALGAKVKFRRRF
jgi:phosphatidylglycerol:prolipoprotein diacylglycerol transferase